MDNAPNPIHHSAIHSSGLLGADQEEFRPFIRPCGPANCAAARLAPVGRPEGGGSATAMNLYCFDLTNLKLSNFTRKFGGRPLACNKNERKKGKLSLVENRAP